VLATCWLCEFRELAFQDVVHKEHVNEYYSDDDSDDDSDDEDDTNAFNTASAQTARRIRQPPNSNAVERMRLSRWYEQSMI
jgi:hypothetical protein